MLVLVFWVWLGIDRDRSLARGDVDLSLCVQSMCVCVDMYDGHVLCMYILSTVPLYEGDPLDLKDRMLNSPIEEKRTEETKDKKKMNRTMMSNHDTHEMMTVNYYN